MRGRGTLVRTGVGLVGLAVALSGFSVAADAAAGSWNDPVADMTDDTTEPAPGHEIGDLRRLKINHADRAVLLRASLTELKRQGQCIALSGAIRTEDDDPEVGPEGFYVEAGFGCEDPGADGWVCGGEMDTFFGNGFECEMDYADDVIRVRIPRVALERPRWVKVAVHTSHHTLRRGSFHDRFDRGWSPRVRRG